MLETFVYYIYFFIIIYILSYIVSVSRNEILKYVIIISISLFIGLRYDVGIDYLEYVREFNLARTILNERFEIIPRYTQYYLSSNDFPYYYWFCLMAFIQIWFLVNYFKEKRIKLLPIGITLFFLMYLSSVTNIIRHICAVLIFINAIQFIEKRKIIPYFLMIFLGYLFHKSILIMLPFYYVNILIFSNLKMYVRLFVLFLSYFLGILINNYLHIFLNIFYFIGYEYTVENFDLNDTILVKEGSGLGRVLNWLLIIVVMIYNDKMKVFYKDVDFAYKTIFNLFFISCIFYEFTGYVIYFQRMFLYFSITNFIMYTFLIYYCLNVKVKDILILRIIGFGVLAVQIIFFIINVLGENKNLSPLKFIDLL